jgi:hypothetical protein
MRKDVLVPGHVEKQLRRRLVALAQRPKLSPRLVTNATRATGREATGEGCAQAEWDPLVLHAARRAAIQASG